jgi:hypothetical protein
VPRYLWCNLTALTQLLNAILGGYPDESTSSRSHRQQHKLRWRIARRVINAMFFWQNDHCKLAYLEETRYRQTDPDIRHEVFK